MTKRLYIGNLPFSATEDEIRELFETHGSIESINVITDQVTGRPRGFAFLEMDDGAAQKAIEALNGHDMGGRPLRVSEARERSDRRGPREPRN